MRRGIPLKPPRARGVSLGLLHPGGALAVYQAILRRRRLGRGGACARPCFAAQEPRWSRLLPCRAALPRLPLGIGGNLTRA